MMQEKEQSADIFLGTQPTIVPFFITAMEKGSSLLQFVKVSSTLAIQMCL